MQLGRMSCVTVTVTAREGRSSHCYCYCHMLTHLNIHLIRLGAVHAVAAAGSRLRQGHWGLL